MSVGVPVSGSGYYEIKRDRGPQEFVDAERFSVCVTFACAMTRRETFEILGGLEEIYVPNGYGDVEMCLRALEAGYRNCYMGSLWGIHHESKSRGLTNEDIEINFVHHRHGRTLASWRHWSLNRSQRHVGASGASWG